MTRPPEEHHRFQRVSLVDNVNVNNCCVYRPVSSTFVETFRICPLSPGDGAEQDKHPGVYANHTSPRTHIVALGYSISLPISPHHHQQQRPLTRMPSMPPLSAPTHVLSNKRRVIASLENCTCGGVGTMSNGVRDTHFTGFISGVDDTTSTHSRPRLLLLVLFLLRYWWWVPVTEEFALSLSVSVLFSSWRPRVTHPLFRGILFI